MDFVDKQFTRTYEEYSKQKTLFMVLNVAVIMISLFGLFALATFTMERRMKEIAIRKTLGASTNSLLMALSKQFVWFCIIGFILAILPSYYLLSKWLENFAFRIDMHSSPYFIGFVLLLMLTLIVVIFKALMATKINILKYLKYE